MKKKIVIYILLFCTISVFGQDMQFTQFYASPLYLNPALTGANACSRVSLAYRNQWPGVNTTYQSYLLSFDHYLQPQHLGIGLQLATDKAGSAGLRTTLINPSFAYEAKLGKQVGVRLGIQPGVTIKSIKSEQLLFGDQISRGGNSNPTSVATVESPFQTKAFVDVGAGALLYTEKLWIGTSFYHINKPNESLTGSNTNSLPVKYSVHGGGKFPLNADEKDNDLRKYISLVMNYRGQGKFDQFDIGAYYSQSFFNLGIWYRGIPGLKAYKQGYSNNDAIAFLAGVELKTMRIGYSYDLTISKLSSKTSGAHEISLSYQFCQQKVKQKKRVLVSCPKF